MKGPNCVPKAHSSTFLKFKILNIRNSDLETFKLNIGQMFATLLKFTGVAYKKDLVF